MLVIKGAETLSRYESLKYGEDAHPKGEKLGFFYAFNNEQFDKGRQMLIDKGFMNEGDKVVSLGFGGCYGTRKGLTDMLNFYHDIDKKIAEECNPQEVYYYEYNNYECCIDYDGDERAIKYIISIWGREVAKKIRRFRDCKPIDEIK